MHHRDTTRRRHGSRNARHVRGFTLIEVWIALGVLAILGLTTFATYSTVTTHQRAAGSRLTLAAAHLAAREVAGNNSYRYPATLADDLVAPPLTFTAGPSTDEHQISILRLSDTKVILAVRPDEEVCIALVDDILSRAGWAVDTELTNPVACDASLLQTKTDRMIGTEDSPARANLG